MAGTDFVPPPAERESASATPVEDGAPIPVASLSAAEHFFGPTLVLARRYAEVLCSTGVERGVIGPREGSRIWDRHLLNCVAIAEVFSAESRVIDVGSGAGLPGIPVALARPDLKMTLLDSLTRRHAFLEELVAELDIGPRVRAVLARAEEHREVYDAVTARAVAPLAKLGTWTRHLVRPGGLFVAIRGEQGQAELDDARTELRRAGWKEGRIMKYGDGLPTPTTVVIAIKA
jgi:16S rRNA (guanine527-N7)-methyltransferase